MTMHDLTLPGRLIRLEPLTLQHAEALAAASTTDSSQFDDSLYKFTIVPQDIDEATQYIRTALEWREAGTAIPFIVIRNSDNAVIGSTRFWNMERWDWPADHERYDNPFPDVSEIGYTWYAPSTIRTGANTEAKYLMLAHAFEVWKVLRISLHTDSRNIRSQNSMERIGFKREGIIRAHKIAVDGIPRDSVRFSMLRAEWHEAKQNLIARLYPD
jgi:N-acetyltransferase